MCVRTCERKGRGSKRNRAEEGKTHTTTHTCMSDTKKEEIKQHFLCLEIQNCHKAMIDNDYKEA